MQADYKVPEVLTGDHAVGVLADQDEVWLDGPARRNETQMKAIRLWVMVKFRVGFSLG